MFKQVYLYDGTAVLLESVTQYTDEGKPIETFSYPKEYTELQPVDGLYQPIFFDGEKWVGTKKEDWEAANPADENVGPGVNVEDVILMNEELLMETSGLSARISKLENKGDV